MPVARPESSDARIIAHVDMDCFYVQVEQRRQPELRGLPTAVVQYNDWMGGGLIAVGYEARKFGVKRSMRGDEAKKVCPEINLVQVPVARGKADLNIYRNAGSEVVAILSQSGRCERASIDEVYLDLTDAAETMLTENPPEMMEAINDEALNSHVLGVDENEEAEKGHFKEWMLSCNGDHRDRLLACGAIIVAELRLQVLKETEFTCSAGIAHNKMLAKLASAMNKPAQQTVVPLSAVNDLLASLPVKKLKQLGGKLGTSLQTDLGVNTVGDLLQFSEANLQERYGVNTGTWLWNVARGVNGDPVEGRLLPKSHGSGKTFPGPRALKSFTSVERWLDDLCEELSERIQSDMDLNNRVAHTLILNARVHKTNEPGSLKKFPSKSCPLRYGTVKLQEDAKKLFNSGLREFLGSFRAETHGHQNNTWAVTGLSVTAGKILATSGTRSILNYFHGKDPFSSSEEHISNENTEDAVPESRSECFSAGNTSELLESKGEETQSNCNDLNLDQDGMRKDIINNKESNSLLRFFHSGQPSCSTSEQTDSGVILDNVPDLNSVQAKADETEMYTSARRACQDEPKEGTILRFFGNQSEPQYRTQQGETQNHGKQKWSFNVDEIDPTVIDELPQEIQDEVRGWLKPPKRPNTSKRGSNIAHYFLPARGK